MRKISIGIPAYNEEGNIGKLLRVLLSQITKSYVLYELIIVSDGSNDKTVEEIKKINDSRINLIENQVRKGKALVQNEILKVFSGDFLVLIDADCLPSSQDFLEKLIMAFPMSGKVGLGSCTSVPTESTTIVGRLLDFSVRLKNSLYDEIRDGNNLYHCHGTCRILTKEFASTLKFPKVPSEDAFSYLECIRQGYSFHFLPEPVMWFKTPSHLKDYLRQSSRFLKGHESFGKYFDKAMLAREYSIPSKAYVSTAIDYILKRPFYFFTHLFGYIILFGISIIYSRFVQASAVWHIADSSKKL